MTSISNVAPQPTARSIHCPICASSIRGRAGSFKCDSGDDPIGHVEDRVYYTLRRAVYDVPAPKADPRKAPELASWFWCPNCTGPMDEFDERGRELRCSSCACSLPARLLQDLIAWKEDHSMPPTWGRYWEE